MELVFVYGTLKSGERASWLMSGHGEKVCDGAVTGRLIDLGAFPGLLTDSDGDVFGEVWLVEEYSIAALDQYEGEGVLYDRIRAEVRCADGNLLNCWTYRYRSQGGKHLEIEGGTWVSKKSLNPIDSECR